VLGHVAVLLQPLTLVCGNLSRSPGNSFDDELKDQGRKDHEKAYYYNGYYRGCWPSECGSVLALLRAREDRVIVHGHRRCSTEGTGENPQIERRLPLGPRRACLLRLQLEPGRKDPRPSAVLNAAGPGKSRR
jgi:hypothetical protein